MPSRRVNPNVIKIHRSYTVGELADRLGVHKNTIRNWQRTGLMPIDDCRPVLFQGAAVRDFLRTQNISRKVPCGPGRFYCLRCRGPRSPAAEMVDFVPITERSGNLRAICERLRDVHASEGLGERHCGGDARNCRSGRAGTVTPKQAQRALPEL
jgi:hypothetical protein